MAIQNLKDVTTCSNNQINLSKIAKDGVAAAEKAAVAEVQSIVNSAVGAVIDAASAVVNAAEASVQSVVDAANAELDAVTSEYNSVKQSVTDVYDKVTGLFSSQCIQPNKPLSPSTNLIHELNSNPVVNNDDIINSSNLTKLQYEKSISASQGVSQLAQTYGKLLNEIKNSAGIYELRTFVDTVDTHTGVQNLLKDLPEFKPFSEYVGSWVMAYTPDTPSLPLECWSQDFSTTPDAPVAVRLNTIQKLSQEMHDSIEESYVKLNNNFVKNISKEFKDGAAKAAPSFVAHGYHIVGDYSFYNYHIKNTPSVAAVTNSQDILTILENATINKFFAISTMLQLIYKSVALSTYGDTYNMIKYLNPIPEEDVKINTDNFEIELTDSHTSKKVVIDKKGNFISEIA